MRNAATTTGTRTGQVWNMLRMTMLATGIVLFALSIVRLDAGATEVDPAALGTMQVAACRGNGGEATVTTERTPEGGLTWVSVVCKGGYSDGVSCGNDTGGGSCYHSPSKVAGSAEGPQVEPTAGIEE